MFAGTLSASAAAAAVSFQIDDKAYETPAGEPAPYINGDGRTMVPIRFVGNALGISNDNIKWNADTSTGTIIKNDTSIQIKVGEHFITSNEQQIKMDTAAELTNERLFIPARYIAEALGAHVEWDASKNTVYILSSSTDNLNRYMTKKQELPVVLSSKKLEYRIERVFIYPVGSEEFSRLVNDNNLATSKETTFILDVSYSLKNKGDGRLEVNLGGENSAWFLSESYSNILTPLDSGKKANLSAGEEAKYDEYYASESKDINQMIFYLQDNEAQEVHEVTVSQS